MVEPSAIEYPTILNDTSEASTTTLT